MLTERQAWLKLAKSWAGPKTKETSSGICLSIDCLFSNVDITLAVSRKMDERVKDHAPPERYGPEGRHRWPMRYRASRAAFCRKMARLLAPKKRAVT